MLHSKKRNYKEIFVTISVSGLMGKLDIALMVTEQKVVLEI